MSQIEIDDIDLNRIIAKPLYFAMVVNVIVPMAGLMFCYYQNQDAYLSNQVGDFADPLFYIFCALALGHAAYGLWWKFNLNKQPMVRNVETFEDDVTDYLNRKSRPIFLIIAAICVYGFLFFFLTGRFNEVVFLVFFSFLVFQVVRPRYGMLKKLLERQLAMVERGEFLRS
jgi:hypothetical protein